MTHHHLNKAACLGAVLLLSACGAKEPSQAEMFETLASGPTKMLFESVDKLEANAKKTGCEKVGEKTFKCGITSKTGEGQVMNYSFVNVDGNWKLSM